MKRVHFKRNGCLFSLKVIRFFEIMESYQIAPNYNGKVNLTVTERGVAVVF